MNPVRNKISKISAGLLKTNRISNGVNIAILGYGVEGRSAFKFLKKQYPEARLEVRDEKLDKPPHQTFWCGGKNYLKDLDKFDMVIRSPGIPYLNPEIQEAKKAGVEVTSATRLFFKYALGKIIGITGTKGKGTVAALLYKILKASGKKILLAGNMGKPMLDVLPKLKKQSITILELSSFQLQDLDRSPDIAVVLDISPDHLNYHKNFKEYLGAKANIAAFQKGGDKVFYFPDNKPPHQKVWCGGKYSKLIAQKSRGRKIAVKPNQNLTLRLPGFHNLKNASIATAVAASLGISQKIIKKTISNFKGLPHRLEFVREARGVKYYNDSAATNPAATTAAIKSFKEPKILIAGGQSKGLSFKPFKSVLKKSNTKLMILYGQNKNEISNMVGNAAQTIKTRDLKSAVELALVRAEKGDVVILSPASTAFDMFSGYAERGKFFKNIIRAI